MTQTSLLAMFSFSLIMSLTPGPVILMIVTSGVNYGFRKTFSFISGATIGFITLLILMALGLSQIYTFYSDFFRFVELLGVCFICYMGYNIAVSKATLEVDNNNKKYLKFHEGFLFQWLNPKAWIAALSGTSMFSETTSALTIFIVLYFFVAYLSLSFWGLLGKKLRKIFSNQKILKIFNILMGSILIFTGLSMLLTNLQKLI